VRSRITQGLPPEPKSGWELWWAWFPVTVKLDNHQEIRVWLDYVERYEPIDYHEPSENFQKAHGYHFRKWIYRLVKDVSEYKESNLIDYLYAGIGLAAISGFIGLIALFLRN
jgi:hypothetical protein